MRKCSILLAFLFFTSCNLSNKVNSSELNDDKDKNFEIVKSKDEKGVLILFPGFVGGYESTKSEFKILDIAKKNNFSVVLMNFGQHVFLRDDEKISLKNKLQTIFENNKLKYVNVYIGGFSSGGNITLLLSDFLIKTQSKIIPKGVFIVDSPIDLLKIYQVSEKNITKNIALESVDESKWIIENFNKDLGNPKDGISNYELYSPFTFKTLNMKNVEFLKNTKIRFYTEPDLVWWKNYNGNDYEDLNASSIDKLSDEMRKHQFLNVEVIKTENKGFRANGNRHPHSWSIIDVNDFMNWMQK
jgi:hypothetical protein